MYGPREEQVATLFRMFDCNRSGSIEFPEFSLMVTV